MATKRYLSRRNGNLRPRSTLVPPVCAWQLPTGRLFLIQPFHGRFAPLWLGRARTGIALTFSFNRLLRATVQAVALVAVFGGGMAHAARVGVLSDRYASVVATDFAAHIPGHTFTAVDFSVAVPTLASLQAQFDEILLFEDGQSTSAPAVGNVVAQFAQSGHTVVLGTFYDQDRSDRIHVPPNAPNPPQPPNGWGLLETLDPNTTDGYGTAYAARSIDTSTIVRSPLTKGVQALFADQTTGYAGGNQAKVGSRVVANWQQNNLNDQPDPAIAYRVFGNVCVIQIGIAPDYSEYGSYGGVYGGDFYVAWQNAFDFGVSNCADAEETPALAPAALAALGLMLALLAGFALRTRSGRQAWPGRRGADAI